MAEGASLEDRRRGGPVTPVHEQRALGGRMDVVSAGQELEAGRVGHPLVRDDEGDALPLFAQALQLVERRLRGEVRDDAVIAPEAASHRVQESRHLHGLVVDNQYERSRKHQ